MTDGRQTGPTIARLHLWRLQELARRFTVTRDVCAVDQLYDLGQGTRSSATGTGTP